MDKYLKQRLTPGYWTGIFWAAKNWKLKEEILHLLALLLLQGGQCWRYTTDCPRRTLTQYDCSVQTHMHWRFQNEGRKKLFIFGYKLIFVALLSPSLFIYELSINQISFWIENGITSEYAWILNFSIQSVTQQVERSHFALHVIPTRIHFRQEGLNGSHSMKSRKKWSWWGRKQ